MPQKKTDTGTDSFGNYIDENQSSTEDQFIKDIVIHTKKQIIFFIIVFTPISIYFGWQFFTNSSYIRGKTTQNISLYLKSHLSLKVNPSQIVIEGKIPVKGNFSVPYVKVFFAASKNNSPRDIFVCEMQITNSGIPIKLRNLHNITNSPHVDEKQFILKNGIFSWVSKGEYVGVILTYNLFRLNNTLSLKKPTYFIYSKLFTEKVIIPHFEIKSKTFSKKILLDIQKNHLYIMGLKGNKHAYIIDFDPFKQSLTNAPLVTKLYWVSQPEISAETIVKAGFTTLKDLI